MIKRQRFWTTWNWDINKIFRFFAIICLIFLTRFCSIKSRDCFSSFFMSFNRRRICRIESSKSSSIFFHKKLWSFSIIVSFWMSYRVFKIVWWTIYAILSSEVNIYLMFTTFAIISFNLSFILHSIFQLFSFNDENVDSDFDTFQFLNIIYLVR
jgi:hypothetical protein